MKKIKKSLKNIIILLILIVLTFIYIFRGQNINEIIKTIFGINIWYVVLALIAMVSYIFFEGVNIKLILSHLNTGVSIKQGFKYSMIGFFFSGITPAATGGQPMQVYVMRKDGVSVANGTLTLIVHLFSCQIMTIVIGILGAILKYHYLENGLIWLFIIGLSLNLILFTSINVCIFWPSLAHKIINFFIKFLQKIKFKRIDKLNNSIQKSLENYKESADFIKKNKIIFVKTIIGAFFLKISYYIIPYFIYKAFGLNEFSLLEMILIQAMLFITVAGIPLPGAVGVSENAFLKIYQTIFKPMYLSSALLVIRGINFYLFMVITLIVTLITLIKIKNNDIDDE